MSADSSPLPDTLHAGYLRPRRRSVWGQERKDTEQLSGSSAVNATVRPKTIVGRHDRVGTGYHIAVVWTRRVVQAKSNTATPRITHIAK